MLVVIAEINWNGRAHFGCVTLAGAVEETGASQMRERVKCRCPHGRFARHRGIAKERTSQMPLPPRALCKDPGHRERENKSNGDAPTGDLQGSGASHNIEKPGDDARLTFEMDSGCDNKDKGFEKVRIIGRKGVHDYEKEWI